MLSSFTQSLRRCFCGARVQTRTAFTLIELLVVISITGALMVLVIPSVGSIKGGGDITKAAYEISGALENARAFAMANNTYVWVGFFEEDGSNPSGKNVAIEGIGRVVISAVASKDGTTIYDPNSSGGDIDPTKLSQLSRLITIENTHLASKLDAFGNRPAVTIGSDNSDNEARIGGSNPPKNSKFPFQYPVGGTTTAPTAQYKFSKIIQFNPRGENVVNSPQILNNAKPVMKPVVEIGLQPTHGNVVDANNKNVAAIQITGLGGNVKIYKR